MESWNGHVHSVGQACSPANLCSLDWIFLQVPRFPLPHIRNTDEQRIF